MPQKDILTAAIGYIKLNNVEEIKKLLLSSAEAPTADTVDSILKKASEAGRREIVKEICQMNGANKPSQNAIDKVVKSAAYSKKWEIVKDICQMKGANKPSQSAIDKIVEGAAYSKKWDLVKKWVGENKPSQKTIDTLLLERAYKPGDEASCNWDIVEYLFSLSTENHQPSQSAIDKIVEGAAYFKKWDLVKKWVGKNKPSQKTIDTLLLERAYKPCDEASCNWDIVEYLCSLSTENHQPSQSAIDKIVAGAAYFKKWDLVKKWVGENKPSQKTIDTLLLERAYKPGDAASCNWDIVEYLCSLPPGNHQPSQSAIDKIVERAACFEKWDLVKKWVGENKPSQKTIDKTIDILLERTYKPGDAASCNWDIVEYLCSLPPGNHQPSQSAIDKIVERAAYFKEWDLVKKWVGENKPSQKTIDTLLLERAYKRGDGASCNWDIVEYLCSLSTENHQPSQSAIDKIVEGAAYFKEWDLVKKWVGENKPSQKTIDTLLLERAYKPGDEASCNWDIVEYLCSLSTENHQPSQSAIDKIVEGAAYFKKWDLVKKWVGENKPSQKTIDTLLLERAYKPGDAASCNWDIVEYLCSLSTENHQPSQSAIDKIVEGAAYFKEWDLVKKWVGENKPSQKTIDTLLLERAYKPGDEASCNWDIVEYLCSLSTENHQPSQSAIDKIVERAAYFKEWDLVKKWVGENKPSQKTIDTLLLERAYKPGDEASCNWDIVEYLCSLSTENHQPSQSAIDKIVEGAAYFKKWDLVKKWVGENKPSQKTIDTLLLERAYKPGDAASCNWDIVEYLCSLSTENHQPSQSAIDKTVERAAYSKKWDLVKKWVGENKPSQKTIDTLLLERAYKPGDGASCNWDIVEYLCSLSTENHQPSQSAIDKTVQRAACSNQWDLIKKLLQINGNQKPSQSAIENLLIAASKSNQLEVIQLICGLPVESCPRTPAVTKALMGAVENDEVSIVRFFSKMNPVNKPSSENFIEAFLWAAENAKLQVVTYFCKLEVENRPNQKLIGKALCSRSLSIVEFLLGDENPIKPDPKDVAQAFLLAVKLNSTKVIKYFCQLKTGNQLNEELIGTALGQAAKIGYLWSVKFLLGPKNPIKPAAKDIAEAFLCAAKSYDTEVIKYLYELKTQNPPNQQLIGQALGVAASLNRLNTVEFLLKPENQIKPAPAAFVDAFLLAAKSCNTEEVIKYLCQLKTENPLTPELIGEALGVAASSNRLKTVGFLLGPDNPLKPIPKSVLDACLLAVEHGHLQIVTYCFSKTQPTPQLMDDILSVALTHKRLNMIKWLLEKDNSHQLDVAGVAKVFNNAISQGLIEDLIIYLIRSEYEFQIEQKIVDQSLLAAAQALKWMVVREICMMKGRNKPSPIAFREALIKAVESNQLTAVEDICRLPVESCPASAVYDAFLSAVAAGHIEIILFLSKLKQLQEFSPDSIKVIDSKLLEAVNTDAGLRIIKCLLQINKTKKILSEEGIEQALVKTAAEGKIKINAYLKQHATSLQINKRPASVKDNTSHETNKQSASAKGNISPKTDKQPALAKDNISPETDKQPASVKDNTSHETNKQSASAKGNISPKTDKQPASVKDNTSLETDKQPASVKDNISPETDKQSASVKDRPLSPEAVKINLDQAIGDKNLEQVKKMCALIGKHQLKNKDFDLVLKGVVEDGEIKNCLRKAKEVLKVLDHIEILRSHGMGLNKKEEDTVQRLKTIELATNLKDLTEQYAFAYFSDSAIAPIQQKFSSALQQGFKEMGKHRAQWRIYLANIVLAATGIGLLINYMVNGSVFFTNTRRQNHVKDIMKDLNNLNSKLK